MGMYGVWICTRMCRYWSRRMISLGLVWTLYQNPVQEWRREGSEEGKKERRIEGRKEGERKGKEEKGKERKMREEGMEGRRNGGRKGRREIEKKRLRSVQTLWMPYILSLLPSQEPSKQEVCRSGCNWNHLGGVTIMNTQFSAQNDWIRIFKDGVGVTSVNEP